MVPDGVFQSTRVGKNRKGDDARARTDVFKVPTSVARTYAAFPAAYPAQPSHFPGSSSPTLAQEPCRVSPQTSHPTAFHHPSEISQYSMPSTLPPLGAVHTLPPLRPDVQDIEYKFRRPSLPGIPDHQPNAPSKDRSASFDQGRSADYSSITNPPPLSRHTATLPTGSPVGDRGLQYRPDSELACTYPSSLRGSTSSFDRPSSRVGGFQPIFDSGSQNGDAFAYNSQAMATTQPSRDSCSQISLPPPAQLFRSAPPTQLYAVRPLEDSATTIGTSRVDLAPLRSLQRRSWRRDPVDDMALRSLGPPSG